jgi:release factor glutamine methyltransferase
MPETGPTLGALLQTALAEFGPEARLDLELLLGEVLGLNRAGLIRERSMPITPAQHARFEALLAGWREGRPVAQLLGRREFWSLDLTIDEHVLVPRPDTELLVETGLALLAEAPDGAVVDLGTGSGAVAIALASELGGRPVIAVERSAAALRVAAHNITGHANQRVLLVQGHWLEALAPACAALIVSNPPYLEDADPGLRADGAAVIGSEFREAEVEVREEAKETRAREPGTPTPAPRAKPKVALREVNEDEEDRPNEDEYEERPKKKARL